MKEKKPSTKNTPPPVYTSGCVRTGPLWLQTIMTLTISISLAQQAACVGLSHRVPLHNVYRTEVLVKPASLWFQRRRGANPSWRPPTGSLFFFFFFQRTTCPSSLILETKIQLLFFSFSFLLKSRSGCCCCCCCSYILGGEKKKQMRWKPGCSSKIQPR